MSLWSRMPLKMRRAVASSKEGGEMRRMGASLRLGVDALSSASFAASLTASLVGSLRLGVDVLGMSSAMASFAASLRLGVDALTSSLASFASLRLGVDAALAASSTGCLACAFSSFCAKKHGHQQGMRASRTHLERHGILVDLR